MLYRTLYLLLLDVVFSTLINKNTQNIYGLEFYV